MVKNSTEKVVASKAASPIENLTGWKAAPLAGFKRKSSYTDSMLPVRLPWSDVYYCSVDASGLVLTTNASELLCRREDDRWARWTNNTSAQDAQQNDLQQCE